MAICKVICVEVPVLSHAPGICVTRCKLCKWCFFFFVFCVCFWLGFIFEHKLPRLEHLLWELVACPIWGWNNFLQAERTLHLLALPKTSEIHSVLRFRNGLTTFKPEKLAHPTLPSTVEITFDIAGIDHFQSSPVGCPVTFLDVLK